ncbi:MAG: 2-oxoacid:ferredoxin oxidoreductase subunit beta [Deltaproteobacteria bacterium]|nr:MAG: 2-oxoacid:ferredoxin oxidoreductase subunit beta [Deltaproteobacteria bacterium]
MSEMKRKEEILVNISQVRKKKIVEKHGRLRPIFCGGCGHFAGLHAVYHMMSELGIENHQLVIVSGIGCSGRFPMFVNCYGFHGVHGRALPVALGVKLANPSLTVLVVGGDGDGLGIGGGHLPHAARSNVDITYILLDNSIYGLTKGQVAPTTPSGDVTSTTPYGNPSRPLDPVKLSLVHGATFVARGFSGRPDELNAIVVEAVKHRGFSLVQVLSPCVTFNRNETYEKYYEMTEPLPGERDLTDWDQAMKFASAGEKIYTGIFYQKPGVKTLDEFCVGVIRKVGEFDDGRITGSLSGKVENGEGKVVE